MATRSASTSGKPAQQRFTARTILLTLTGSLPPLRFFTRIVVCGYDAESMSDCEAKGNWGFEEETDGLNILLYSAKNERVSPLQNRGTRQKRHDDRTRTGSTRVADGALQPPPSRQPSHQRRMAPGRWVLAGLRAYEPSGRTRLPTAHCFPARSSKP